MTTSFEWFYDLLLKNKQNPTCCPTMFFSEHTDYHRDIGETRGNPEMNNHPWVHVRW